MINSKKRMCILSLTAALMLTTLSVTGCGGSITVNSNKDETTDEAPVSGSEDGSENEPEEAPDTAITADTEEYTVYLNSKATRGPGYISVNETFTDQKGNQYNLFMNGLKEENKDAMLEALSLYYDADREDGLKICDDAFADAEKYSDYADLVEDLYDELDDELDDDSAQCWAGALADALWVTGWADKLQNPITGNAFSSEDDVFRYYNQKISNGSGDSADAADYIFMGEFYMSAYDGSKVASVLYPGNPEDGLMKSFFSSNLFTKYDLIKEPDDIKALEHCGNQGSDATDFCASVGSLGIEGEVDKSGHAVSAVGVITDPNAASTEESMKAILFVDPDNDAHPSEDDGVGENLTLEQRNAAKEARPNSVTVYNLQRRKDTNDVPYWLVMGYIAAEDEPGAVLYDVAELPQYNEDIIAANTETEGTKTAYDSVDMALELLFTTDETEAIDTFYETTPDDVTVTEFSSGDPVNLNFLVSNRGSVILNEDYLNGKELIVDWSVVRDDDGSVVAKDEFVIDDSIYFGETNGYLINLNQDGNKAVSWDPGDYTVTLDLNVDRSVPEAYFLNNVPKECHFTIK